VLHKSGDVGLPQNYRPITVIPLLYKLFAKLIYSRLQPVLESAQSIDQAGFRHSYSTVDHLHTFSQISEKAYEYQVGVWVAALDFKKAFDTIEHAGLWEALAAQNVSSAYIALLKSLYSQQTARVRTDAFSRTFDIQRGTKQGDPLSSLLFNALLEHIMRPLKEIWSKKQYGLQLHSTDGTRLTNLRFADDVLLVARSQRQLSIMLTDVCNSSGKYGLEIHPDKTKVLTNTTKKTGRGRDSHLDINGLEISILPLDKSLKYLGRQLTFGDGMAVEIAHRIRCGWAKFHSYKQEITSKNYSLHDRLRVFEAVVSPTVLYGCSSWTLTQDLEKVVSRTQRRMLRMILGSGRRLMATATEGSSQHDADSQCSETLLNPPDVDTNSEGDHLEPWVDWIRRTTHAIEHHTDKLKMESWIKQVRRRKFEFAGRLSHISDNRWSVQATNWDPAIHFDGMTCKAGRRQARPRRRWCDELNEFAQSIDAGCENWRDLATDAEKWDTLSDKFVEEEWRQRPQGYSKSPPGCHLDR